MVCYVDFFIKVFGGFDVIFVFRFVGPNFIMFGFVFFGVQFFYFIGGTYKYLIFAFCIFVKY